MLTNVTNKGPGQAPDANDDLRAQVTTLQAQVERLENLLATAAKNTPAAMANAVLAREARRLSRQQSAAREVKDCKRVKVRVQRFAEKIVNKRIVKVDNSRPIALSSTWRNRGIWPDAPSVLEPFDAKGEPITHSVPERVYEALKDELVPV
jgi:hypothetical protein